MRAIVMFSVFLGLFLGAWPAWAVQIADGDFRIDIAPGEGEWTCVTLPEALYNEEDCDGVDVAIFNQRLREGIPQGGPSPVASVLVRGDGRFELVLILRDEHALFEFDKRTAKAFVREHRDGWRKGMGEPTTNKGNDLVPMEMRRNGVQLIGYEVTMSFPPKDDRHVTSAMIHWTAATSRGYYHMTFASSPEEMTQSRALVERSLTTLQAMPGSPPLSAMRNIVLAGMALLGVLVALGVGLYFLIRAMVKRPAQAPKTYYGYNAPPPPPPAA